MLTERRKGCQRRHPELSCRGVLQYAPTWYGCIISRDR